MISRSAPFHPIFVHFTIALVATSFVSDVLAQIARVSSLTVVAWWTIGAAAPATVLTVITGLISRRHAAIAEGRAMRYLRFHTALGPIFLGCLIAVAYWRTTSWMPGSYPGLWYLVVSGFLVAMMTVQGFVGGELVYGFGVEVRRHYKRLPLRES
jgi:uncharacterized membrane protein